MIKRALFLSRFQRVLVFVHVLIGALIHGGDAGVVIELRHTAGDHDAAAADLRRLLEKWESAGCVEVTGAQSR